MPLREVRSTNFSCRIQSKAVDTKVPGQSYYVNTSTYIGFITYRENVLPTFCCHLVDWWNEALVREFLVELLMVSNTINRVTPFTLKTNSNGIPSLPDSSLEA